MLQGRGRNVLQGAHRADGGQRLAWSKHPGADRGSDGVCLLLPGRLAAGVVNGEDGHIPVLGEWLAVARKYSFAFRVDRSQSAISAYRSISCATVTSVSG